MRLFIGCFIPDSVSRYIFDLEQRISSMKIPAKFTSQKNIHMTFKFLGETGPETAVSIIEILESYKNLGLLFSLDRVSWFDRGQNSILFLELSGDIELLKKNVEKLDCKLERLGIEREKKKFKAHITIGRKAKLDRISKEKIASIPIEPLTFTIDEFNLVESTLTKHGAIYKILF